MSSFRFRRCRYQKIPGRRSWAFIPQCIGGSVHGREGCTCRTDDEIMTSFARGIIRACHYAVAMCEAEARVSTRPTGRDVRSSGGRAESIFSDPKVDIRCDRTR